MKQCLVCRQEAKQVRPFEKLPNNATAVEAIHADNTRHTWTEYRSMDDLGKSQDRNPIYIKCPMCHKEGRLGSYHPDNTRQEFVTYYVKHKRGATNKGTHYITDPMQRIALLKSLGRFIDPLDGNGNGNGKAKAIAKKTRTKTKPIEISKQDKELVKSLTEAILTVLNKYQTIPYKRIQGLRT